MRSDNILKSQDAWIAVYGYDHLAMFLLKIIEKYFPKTTPNQITAIGLAFSVGALFCVLYQNFLLAAMLLQVSALLDCVDGKWARYTSQFSPFGKKFDALGDLFAHTFVGVVAAYMISGHSMICAAVLVITACGAAYIHLRALFDVSTEGNLNMSPFGSKSWYSFCKRRRTLARPISEVEMTFTLPSLILVFYGYFAMEVLSVIVVVIFLIGRYSSRRVE
jgi:phosphatidylglycerophosphate synthase